MINILLVGLIGLLLIVFGVELLLLDIIDALTQLINDSNNLGDSVLVGVDGWVS